MPEKTNKDSWYDLRINMADSHADLYIYGVIGWDVTPSGLVSQLKEHKNLNSITVHINSVGGFIGEGLTILNTLRRHEAHVTTIVEGYALSMGSVIAQAGDVRQMADNALMMIHRAQGGAFGDANDMMKEAEILEKHEQALIKEYMRVMDASSEEIKVMLDQETWFTSDEALAAGLVGEIIDAVDLEESESNISHNHWQAAASAGFKHAPAAFSQRLQHYLSINKGLTMPEKKEGQSAKDSPKNTPTVDAQAIAREAVVKENQRQNDIRAAFKTAGDYLGDEAAALMETCLADMDCDKARANEVILEAMGKLQPNPIGSHAHVIEDEKDRFKTGVVASLSARAGIIKSDDKTNNFRGYTLLELARAALKMNGVGSNGMSKMDVVAAAFTHSSGDFSSLLANVAEKSMLMGYDEAEETFQAWTVPGEASDFKSISRVDLNSFPSLSKIPEGSEYTYGTIGDRGETVQLATYGKLFSITRQAIINDDLSAFTRIPQRMGRAAIRTVGDLVYAVLTGNPTMSDSIALFHASHNNLLSGTGINTASVDAMRVAMGTQKDGGSNAHALNIRLAHLLVPMALEGTANVVANSEFEVGASNKNNTVPNSVRGTFNVVADARLDATSAIEWYGSASPSNHDTVEVTYLDGQQQPYLESQNGWNVDGAEFKVRIDAAVNPLDFRTMAKNPGV